MKEKNGMKEEAGGEMDLWKAGRAEWKVFVGMLISLRM